MYTGDRVEWRTAVSEAERRQLFNGRDLTGWQMLGRGGFRVEDELLLTEGGMGLLGAKRLGESEI